MAAMPNPGVIVKGTREPLSQLYDCENLNWKIGASGETEHEKSPRTMVHAFCGHACLGSFCKPQTRPRG